MEIILLGNKKDLIEILESHITYIVASGYDKHRELDICYDYLMQLDDSNEYLQQLNENDY